MVRKIGCPLMQGDFLAKPASPCPRLPEIDLVVIGPGPRRWCGSVEVPASRAQLLQDIVVVPPPAPRVLLGPAAHIGAGEQRADLQLGGRLGPVSGLLREAAQRPCLEVVGKRLLESLGRRRGLGVQVVTADLHHRLALEDVLPGEQEVAHGAQGVEVAARVDVLGRGQGLGRHVERACR